MNNSNVKNQMQESNIQEASPQMKRIIGIVSLLFALFLSINIIDKAFSSSLIAISKGESKATITKLSETTSKGTRNYRISYSFVVNNKSYERTAFFGLFKAGTKILSSEKGNYLVGENVDINYSTINPKYNQTVIDPFRSDKNIFMIIGAGLFWLLGINQIRNLKSLKKHHK